jgi:hypothetical protein
MFIIYVGYCALYIYSHLILFKKIAVGLQITILLLLNLFNSILFYLNLFIIIIFLITQFFESPQGVIRLINCRPTVISYEIYALFLEEYELFNNRRNIDYIIILFKTMK